MLRATWRRFATSKTKFDLDKYRSRVVTPALCQRMGVIFRDMGAEKMSVGERFRSRSHYKASAVMFKLYRDAAAAEREGVTADPITIDMLAKTEGLGEGSLARIVEVLDSPNQDSLAEHDAITQQPLHAAAKLVSDIHGFGPKTAAAFVQKHPHITSIDDIRALAVNDPDLFTTGQLLGIRHYEDSRLRIPRAEVDLHRQLLLDAAAQIDPALNLELAGSYRRGLQSTGDVDCLLSWGPNATDAQVKRHFSPAEKVLEDTDNGPVVRSAPSSPTPPSKTKAPPKKKSAPPSYLPIAPMHELLRKLQQDKYVVGCLACGDTKTMAYCRLDSGRHVRRLDIRWVDRDSFATALLYFTGSADFNTRMRIAALEKGYTLNEYGLFHLKHYRATTANGGKKTKASTKAASAAGGDTPRTKGSRVPCTSEKDVFAAIGMDYVEPNCRSA